MITKYTILYIYTHNRDQQFCEVREHLPAPRHQTCDIQTNFISFQRNHALRPQFPELHFTRNSQTCHHPPPPPGSPMVSSHPLLSSLTHPIPASPPPSCEAKLLQRAPHRCPHHPSSHALLRRLLQCPVSNHLSSISNKSRDLMSQQCNSTAPRGMDAARVRMQTWL